MPRAPEPPKKKKKNSPLACSGSTLCKKFKISDEDPSSNVDAVSIRDILTFDLLFCPLIVEADLN